MDRKEERHIEYLFNALFVKSGREEYLDIVNSTNQRFYIPYKSVGLGLVLYHPSRMKGKLIKFFLPIIKHSTLLLSKLGFKRIRLNASPFLYNTFASLFPDKKLDIAVFCGTPGIHRKITVQISHRKKILAYAKISNQSEVKVLFNRESEFLRILREKHIESIPQVLLQKEFASGISVFIQSAVKKGRSLCGIRDEQLIWSFLSELQEKTAVTIPFAASGYYDDLQQLKELISKYSLKESAILENAITEVETFFSTHNVSYSVYHGDLTPWNMYFHQDKLYVFDWEYAEQTYPPFLDYFHYFTQCAFYERRWDAARIIQRFNEQKGAVQKYVSHPSIYYKAYLLAIIQFYIGRDKDSSKGSLQTNYNNRINLLTLID